MLKKIFKNPQAVTGLVIIAIVAVSALLAPLLAPHDPNEKDLLIKFSAPCADYPLGTDSLGRCVFCTEPVILSV